MKFEKAIPHNIDIRPSNNGGFFVRVGCANLVYSKSEKDKMVNDFSNYLNNPEEFEKKYNTSGCSGGPVGYAPTTAAIPDPCDGDCNQAEDTGC